MRRNNKHRAGTVIGGIGFALAGVSVSCVDAFPVIGVVGTLVGLAMALVGARKFEREEERR